MKKLLLITLSLVLISGLLFAGCAEPAPTPAPTTPAPTTPAPTTPAPTTPAPTTPAPPEPTEPLLPPAPVTPPELEPQYGGVVKWREAMSTDVAFGDPLDVFGPFMFKASAVMQRLLYPGDKPGSYRYMLATGYELAPDKSYYDIFLREGVLFHDGTEFNARAVKWNLDRVKEAGRAELKKVTSITVVDDYTIRLNLSSWDNRILNDLMHDACLMTSPTAFVKNGKEWIDFHPVGTGPFMFKEIKGAQVVIFERNPNYWEKDERGNQLPYLDAFESHYIPDDVVAEAALKAGEVHALGGFDMSRSEQFESEPDKYNVWNPDTQFLWTMYMNTANPDCAWHDPRLRQALEYASDKEAVAKAVMTKFHQPRYNIIKGLENVTEVKTVPRKYDPAKAKELMTAAGYPDGLSFKFYIGSYHFGGLVGDALLVYQQQWADVGFQVEFVPLQFAASAALAREPIPGNDVSYESLRGNLNPIEVIVEALGEGSAYYVGVKRPDAWADLQEQAMLTEDPEHQLELLVEMDRIAYEEAMVIPLVTAPLIAASTTRLHNFDHPREGLEIAECWLSEE